MDWTDFINWIALPAYAGMAGLLWRHIEADARRFETQAQAHDKAFTALRSELADYKLVVATTYASQGYLRDVEMRLIGHLSKIEEKLDRLVEGKIKE
jgi:hypothetical protein